MAWIGGGVVVLGGATLFGTRSVLAKVAERDLTRLGQGVPTVVQVHDPQCPTCNALQSQTRQALKGFGQDELQYLVADIKTQEGQSFAGRYGVPHVTLLLFDGEGNLVETLQGMRPAAELRPAFERLAK
ncbi:thioredoxin family protein [Roseovarius phycicola]|uniref:Thioredoxin family protein n=1 Tax=Roseovarius phycicola TaxID=3080976 RepID=A0ABZ2HEJ7_9RHOB